MAWAFPSTCIDPQETGQHSGEPSTECRQHQNVMLKAALMPLLVAAPVKLSKALQADCCDLDMTSPLDSVFRALSVFLNVIGKTLEVCMQSTTTADTMKTPVQTVSSDFPTKPTIVLHFPGIRLAVLTSAYDSLLHLDVTLSSATSVLLVTYVICVLAWNIFSFVFVLLAQTVAFVLITFYTFTGLAMLSMHAMTSLSTAMGNDRHISKLDKKTKSATPTLPLLCVDSTISLFQSTYVSTINKTDDTSAFKRKELEAPARRRVLAHLNRNRLLINVVPADKRRRVDMNLGNANIRVGKAFIQMIPGKSKPRDIYVVRMDCGAQSTTNEKHMNPVIMWDITATFDEFKQLERDLNKEIRAEKKWYVKVPHLSSGAVLFVQPELTTHVLNARRVRLQTFIDTVRSDPVLSTTGCLRKFCQAY